MLGGILIQLHVVCGVYQGMEVMEWLDWIKLFFVFKRQILLLLVTHTYTSTDTLTLQTVGAMGERLRSQAGELRQWMEIYPLHWTIPFQANMSLKTQETPQL